MPLLRAPYLSRLALTLVAALLPAIVVTVGATPASATVARKETTTFAGLDTAHVMKDATPAALTAFVKSKGSHSAVKVLDRTTGATIALNEDRAFQTASIVKFDILATRLYQTQRAGSSLSSSQRALAFKMITQSDNNAASALYALDHRASGVAAANKAFGLRDTVPNASWGKTRTTAADQVRLLGSVFSSHGPLNSTNQQYMLSLMSKVEPDQAWGITAAATDDATGVYVKNGWVEMDAYGHLEGDNSIGRIIEPGHDWLIATMSNYNRSDPAGERILEGLAKIAVGGLRYETAPATE